MLIYIQVKPRPEGFAKNPLKLTLNLPQPPYELLWWSTYPPAFGDSFQAEKEIAASKPK